MIGNALEKYTNAVDARNEHMEANKPVFDSHQKLVFAVIDAENELRDEVAGMQGLPTDKNSLVAKNASYEIYFAPQTQRVYDDELLSKLLSPEELTKVIKEIPRPTKTIIKAME
jgi:hypothetical protein